MGGGGDYHKGTPYIMGHPSEVTDMNQHFTKLRGHITWQLSPMAQNHFPKFWRHALPYWVDTIRSLKWTVPSLIFGGGVAVYIKWYERQEDLHHRH